MMDWELQKWKQELSAAIIRLSQNKQYEESFTHLEFCPANLIDALRDMGWEDDELEDNGWQNDCWTYFSHYDYDFVLVLYYCGHTFELTISPCLRFYFQSNKTVANTQVENGALYIEFKIPYLPAREHELSILLGENYRYNYMKVNSTCTIYKQNVSVRIAEVKSKPGYNVTLKAVLINTLTNTNVVSGKYIFKVDGVRVPLAVNGSQIYTMKIVDNAVALWTYTLPENIAKGIHDVTLAYNGNTQSNPVKYTSKALTVF